MDAMTAVEYRQVIEERMREHEILAEHSEHAHYYRHVPSGKKFASVTTKGGSIALNVKKLQAWASRLAIEHWEEKWKPDMSKEELDKLRKACIMVHNDVFKDAGDIGTFGHEVVENYLKQWIKTGEKPADIRTFATGDDVRLYAIARSAEKFFDDYYVEPVCTELLVASLKYVYAGQLDSLMMIAIEKQPGRMKCPKHCYLIRGTKNKNKLQCGICEQKADLELALIDFKTSNSISDKPSYCTQTTAYKYALIELTGIKPKHVLIVRFDKKQAKYEIQEVHNHPQAFEAFLHSGYIYDWLVSREPKQTNYMKKVVSIENL